MSRSGPTVLNDRYECIASWRDGDVERHMARDADGRRAVAVKVMFPEVRKAESFVERFRRAGPGGLPNQRTAHRRHSTTWGKQANTYFLAWKYVRAAACRRSIATKDPLHPPRAAEVAADGLRPAIGFAHRTEWCT